MYFQRVFVFQVETLAARRPGDRRIIRRPTGRRTRDVTLRAHVAERVADPKDKYFLAHLHPREATPTTNHQLTTNTRSGNDRRKGLADRRKGPVDRRSGIELRKQQIGTPYEYQGASGRLPEIKMSKAEFQALAKPRPWDLFELSGEAHFHGRRRIQRRQGKSRATDK